MFSKIRLLSLGGAVLLLLPGAALAAAVCADRVPATIAPPANDKATLKCQKAIAKEGEKFLNAKTKALGACLLKEAPGVCPGVKETQKIEKAALKATDKIAKACDAGAIANLGAGNWDDVPDGDQLASCMLSQHNLAGELVVRNAIGASSESFPGEDDKLRSKCIKELGKSGPKYAMSVLKTIDKCIDKQFKAGGGGDVTSTCVGQWTAGAFVAPSDAKTASKLAKLQQQVESKLEKKCGPAEAVPGTIASIFGCPGAATVEDLQSCLVCQGWDGALDAVEAQFAEGGSFVAHGASPTDPNTPGVIQTAVDAGGAGARLLIESGTYAEQTFIDQDGVALIGCGGALDERPVIVPPPFAAGNARGIQAIGESILGPDDLPDPNSVQIMDITFQSLEVSDWPQDGIFVSGADGVYFRDIIGDGDLDDSGVLDSVYAVFPVQSRNVVVEACVVEDIIDAGIYVGQSQHIRVAHNDVRDSVAGIEIENSEDAFVHNNYATDNTGGLLVFKLTGPAFDTSKNHVVSHNVLEGNNEENIGSGAVGAVPAGTGLMIVANDDSLTEYNVSRDNRTFGLLLIDQIIADDIPTSPDQNSENNLIRRNALFGNGFDPDVDKSQGLFGELAVVLGELAPNCITDNEIDPAGEVITIGLEDGCP